MKKCFSFFIVLFISLALYNCKGQKNQSTDSEKKVGTIEMSKTPCHGRCPIYKIKISTSGEVTYEGERNVDKLGIFRKKLSEKEVKDLFDSFNSSIYNFQDLYDGNITDIPSTKIAYNYDGKSKNIVDRWKGPEELKKLEKLVEAIADSSGWEKVAEQSE